MKKIKKSICISLFLLYLIIQIQGCTLIGLYMGVKSDDAKADILYINELSLIEKGTKILIVKRDSTYVLGTFTGFDSKDENEYIETYNKYRNNDINNNIHDLGEISIHIVGTKVKINCIFVGVDFDGLILKKTELDSPKKNLLSRYKKLR